jgi:hypothetical protein
MIPCMYQVDLLTRQGLDKDLHGEGLILQQEIDSDGANSHGYSALALAHRRPHSITELT